MMKFRALPAKLLLVGAVIATQAAYLPPTASADTQPKHEGCFGRISTQPTCSQEQGKRATFIAPFRKPGQPYSIGKRPEARASFGSGSAAIVSQSFRKVSDSMGEWSGVVSGDGIVHLALQIFENGAVKSTRYIGNVTLSKDSTTFHFRSTFPAGAHWDWKVVAFNPAA